MIAAEAEALFAEGAQRMAAGDDASAESAFLKALDVAPDLAEAWANLALLRQRAGAPEEAEAHFRQALALDPHCVQTLLNFAVFLLSRKRFGEAEAANLEALRLAPASPMAWSNYGVLLASCKREAEAEQCYRTALGLDSGYRKARFNLAYVQLRQGRFAEGWASLEARDWYAPLERHLSCPRWRGVPLAGKALLVGLEAGHGDMIQFCRFVPLLKARDAATVALVCHPGLKTLLSTLPGVDAVYSIADDVPSSGWDFWSPPLSLPYRLETTLSTIPAQIPYLRADPDRVASWDARLPADGLRVGLAWKGNPRFENDADRSLPSLDVLAPVSAVGGVRFVSLQKGAGEDEALAPPAGLSLLALGGELDDFAETAAVIACLDLVISVDTAVAHLAGALGKPCWLLLPDYQTDWRWLTGRDDSPWYPGTMRLFRQAADGVWTPVVARVAEALAGLTKNRLRLPAP